MSGAPHIPVLLEEVLVALAPAPGSLIVDATFGAGGYAAAAVTYHKPHLLTSPFKLCFANIVNNLLHLFAVQLAVYLTVYHHYW